jgi:hypothetical protein
LFFIVLGAGASAPPFVFLFPHLHLQPCPATSLLKKHHTTVEKEILLY